MKIFIKSRQIGYTPKAYCKICQVVIVPTIVGRCPHCNNQYITSIKKGKLNA